jgi:hypothetical protein
MIRVDPQRCGIRNPTKQFLSASDRIGSSFVTDPIPDVEEHKNSRTATGAVPGEAVAVPDW